MRVPPFLDPLFGAQVWNPFGTRLGPVWETGRRGAGSPDINGTCRCVQREPVSFAIKIVFKQQLW